MTTYYVIVFVDNLYEKEGRSRHESHGNICNLRAGIPYVFTNLKDASEKLKYWNDRSEFWKGCYELWEFDINEEELK